MGGTNYGPELITTGGNLGLHQGLQGDSPGFLHGIAETGNSLDKS